MLSLFDTGLWVKCGAYGTLFFGHFIGENVQTWRSHLTRKTSHVQVLGDHSVLIVQLFENSNFDVTAVVSATGAGDAMIAALATSMLQGRNPAKPSDLEIMMSEAYR